MYTACDGVSSDQVFRAVSPGTFPPSVEFTPPGSSLTCYGNPQTTALTSYVNVNGLTSFSDCADCTAVAPVAPTVAPVAPTNVPVMTTNSSTNVTSNSFTANGSLNTANGTVTSRGFYIGTNSSYISNTQYPAGGTALGNYSYAFTGATAGTTYYVTAYAVNEHGTGVGSTITTPTPIAYDYEEYTECGGTATRIFRLESPGTFPTVLADVGLCWGNGISTTTSSLNDAAGLTSFNDCAACGFVPVAPTVAPVAPTVAPTVASTRLFSTYTVGNGAGNSATACAAQTTHSIYTSSANVASIQTGDVIYTNSGLTNVWNGGLKWYGVTNTTGKYPNLDSGYSFLINTNGAVDSIVDCSSPPVAPTVAPTAATFQDIRIRQCFTTTPVYDVRVTGLTAPTLANGQSIKITGPANSPNPQFTATTCWEIIDEASAFHNSDVTLNTLDSSCTGCGAVPQYDYATYTECQTSATAVFRKLTTTTSFPSFVEYTNICYSNPVPTTATSTISVENLTSFNNCLDCENPSMFINGLPQGGYIEADGCLARTDYFVFSNRATVGQIIAGDTLCVNSSKTTVFNGGSEWYSISNTQGYLPQSTDSKYFILANGTVQTITTCAAAPTTAPVAPTAAPTTNIEVEDCNNPGAVSRAYVTVNGTYGASAIGLALKLSGGTGGSCNPGFDGTKCWEIKAVNTTSDCSSTVLSVNTECNSCTPVVPTAAPTTAPVAPTAAPTTSPVSSNYYFTISRCDGGVPLYTEIVSTQILAIGSSVLLSDGNCYLIDDVPAGINSNTYVQSYTDCTTCISSQTPTAAPTAAPTVAPSPVPTAAPTVAPSVNCFAINAGSSSISGFEACEARQALQYFDTANLCTATLYYGTTAGCSTPFSSAIYVSDGVNQRLWNGSTFSTLCTPC